MKHAFFFCKKEADMADDKHSSNDEQADELIQSLSGKMVEAILPKINASVEDQIQGIVKKNSELLDKLAQQKRHNDVMDTTNRTLVAADAAFQKRLDKDGKMSFDNSSMKSVKLAKGDALDPVKYRAAKALAEKHKVPLEIDRS